MKNKFKNLDKMLLASIILCLLCLAFTSMSIIRFKAKPLYIDAAFSIMTLYYGLYAYKKPHSNDLKYIMMIFSAGLALRLSLISREFNPSHFYAYNFATMLFIVSIVLIAYMSGRLERIEENQTLSVIVLACLSAAVILFKPEVTLNAGSIIAMFTLPVSFFSLMLSYVARYSLHIEAGGEKEVPLFKK